MSQAAWVPAQPARLRRKKGLRRFLDKKIAIVLLWSDPYTDRRTGGIVRASLILRDNLKALGIKSTCLFFSDRKKNDPAWHPAYSRLRTTEAEILNGYDGIVFSPAGSFNDIKTTEPWWASILDTVRTPFVTWHHNENEVGYLPFRERFYRHPFCVAGLAIAPEIGRAVIGECCPRGLIYPAHPCYMPSFYDGQPKEASVVATCRLTSRKRLLELVEYAGIGIAAAGLRLDIWGMASSYFYLKKMQELQQPWQYCGMFDFEERGAILNPAMFHYGATWLKRATFAPRLEIVTVDAIQYGCCPILAKGGVPSWVTGEHAVFVDPNDMDSFRSLGERLLLAAPHAQEMAEALRIEARHQFNMLHKTAELASFFDGS
jgi:hypothetical protein